MGNRCSTLTAEISPVAEREITWLEQFPPVHANPVRAPASKRPTRSRAKSAPQKVPTCEDLPPSPAQRSRTKSAPQKLQSVKTGKGGNPLPPQTPTANPAPRKVQTIKDSTPSLAHRFRAKSAPLKVQSIKDGDGSPPLPSERSRAKSSIPSSSKGIRSDVELMSTVREMLPEEFKFRILVVGKNGSGKSSLVKAVFKVDVTKGAPEGRLGKADIDLEFRPEDNRYLIVHEYSGFNAQVRDSADLQTIRDFISRRTDPSRSPSERLHAVWICVPASDAIEGGLGEGVEEILSLRTVPVVIVFTKFDVFVSRVLFDIADGDILQHERARARAHINYEDSCRRVLHKEPRDVPAEVVSENPRFVDLIDNLVMSTDSFITASCALSTQAGVRGAKQRIGAVPLAWSAALRANHDIIIQATIEVGRNRYWSSLWLRPDFAHKTLKNCVKIIHLDIVEIWNMNDKNKYLSSDDFQAELSHLVKDLARPSNVSLGAGDDYADWVHDVYRGGRDNVRCVMGWIVELTVIMDGIFRMAAGDMSPEVAQQVLERHVRSGRSDAIHRDIRNFIAEALAIRSFAPQRDLVLERIIDLIKQYCVPP
ncbi:hypothetical protein V8E53_005508 [Lactarius tabidus]